MKMLNDKSDVITIPFKIDSTILVVNSSNNNSSNNTITVCAKKTLIECK